MRRKQHFIFAGVVMILVILACQSSANLVLSPGTESLQSREIFTPVKLPTPIASMDNGLLSKIPSNFLADLNTACAIHDDHALSCLDGNGWHVYEADTFDPPYIPEVIARCPDGYTYLSVGEGEVYQLEGKTLVDTGNNTAYQGNTIICGNGNEIWTGSMYGVSQFDGATWTHHPALKIFGSSGSEGSEIINSMAVAPNGNVWVTTNKNIATFDGTGWRVVTPPGNNIFPISDNLRRKLIVDTNGNVWAVTENDGHSQLLKYGGGQWYTFSGPENYIHILFIVLDRENRVWAATHDNQIYTLDPQTNNWILQFGTRQFGVGYYALRAMQFDRQNRLWVASNYGLDIYDGSLWTTYYMHTADLYANDIDDILIFGDGPQLSALAAKAPGSVRGRLVNQDSTAYTDAQVEICLKPVKSQFSGGTPCANQAFHALATVGTDGNFVFTDIPAGRYYLMVRVSYSWGTMMDPDLSSYSKDIEFEVKPGEVTQLGEIET